MHRGDGLDLRRLLASVANSDRYHILEFLESSPLRLVDVARALKVTPQEAKRHIVNLVENDLIERGSDGRYFITGLGSIVLGFTKVLERLTESYKFLVDHIVDIPLKFFPAFLQGRLIDGSLISVEMLNDIILNADKKLYIHLNGVFHIYNKIEPVIQNCNDFKAVLDKKDLMMLQNRIKNPIRFKVYSGQPKMNIVLNEKEAILFLKSKYGTIDFNQAYYGNGEFRWMCERLFEHLWDKSKYIPELLSPSALT